MFRSSSPLFRVASLWNEFFLKATGLSERDAKRLTIFAIVQSTELSNLYKMVARAMESSMKSDSSGDGQASSMSGKLATAGSSSTKSTGDREAWPATTLKCISFPKKHEAKKKKPACTPKRPNGTHHPHPLYITVALMEGNHCDQRCFHCILTDRPRKCDKSKLGSVTPELFALLATPDIPKKHRMPVDEGATVGGMEKEV